MSEAKVFIEELVGRAKKAQKIAEGFTQEQVDELVAAIAWSVSNEETAR